MFHVLTKYVQSRLLQICRMWERVNYIITRALDNGRFACSKMLIWPSNPIFCVPNFFSHSDDSLEYPQHKVCFNNKREIVGKRAALSGPLITDKLFATVNLDTNPFIVNFGRQFLKTLEREKLDSSFNKMFLLMSQNLLISYFQIVCSYHQTV